MGDVFPVNNFYLLQVEGCSGEKLFEGSFPCPMERKKWFCELLGQTSACYNGTTGRQCPMQEQDQRLIRAPRPGLGSDMSWKGEKKTPAT